jgi:hypothetical protein
MSPHVRYRPIMKTAHRLLATMGLLMAALPAAVAQQPAAPVTPPALPVVPAPSSAQPLPPPHWAPDQIRQAFALADSDSNGELSRAEAQRLTIVPRGFEDMDQNKDGVLTRIEFEAAFAR